MVELLVRLLFDGQPPPVAAVGGMVKGVMKGFSLDRAQIGSSRTTWMRDFSSVDHFNLNLKQNKLYEETSKRKQNRREIVDFFKLFKHCY